MSTNRYKLQTRYDRHPIHMQDPYTVILDTSHPFDPAPVLNARGLPRKFRSESGAQRVAGQLEKAWRLGLQTQ